MCVKSAGQPKDSNTPNQNLDCTDTRTYLWSPAIFCHCQWVKTFSCTPEYSSNIVSTSPKNPVAPVSLLSLEVPFCYDQNKPMYIDSGFVLIRDIINQTILRSTGYLRKPGAMFYILVQEPEYVWQTRFTIEGVLPDSKFDEMALFDRMYRRKYGYPGTALIGQFVI
jgi:hypothetical protein